MEVVCHSKAFITVKNNKLIAKFNIFSAFLLIFLNLSTVAADPLYSDSDPILQLNETSFYPSILGKNTAFVIEFYNSWCGHCIRYAPVWKSFAKDIQSWHDVVVVAAIDCAIEENFPRCTHYRIPLFPTVKFLWTNLTKEDLGDITSHDNDISVVRRDLIDFLEKNWITAPTHFPYLLERSERSISELWQNIPKHITNVFVILESNNSYVGKEVILDTSALKNVVVIRVTNNTEKLVQELNERVIVPTVPALLLLNRNGDLKTVTLASSMELARQELHMAILRYLGKSEEVTSSVELSSTVSKIEISVPPISVADSRVNLVDLENAIHYLLMQEVGMKAVLVEDDLSAFKAFLAALTKTFPGNEPTMNFLRRLYQWVCINNVSLQTNDMYNFIKSIQKSNEVEVPPMHNWVHCKGSKSGYRGYPCGLWTLFHTMTVQAYNKYLTGEMVNPQQVLTSIKGYVLHFFSCGDCAKHFEIMSMDMEGQLRHPNDTIVWLWNAHNKVNKRLAGDKTEDPLHPKVHFPPKIMCAQCYQRLATRDESSLPLWNMTAVIAFLRKFYSDIKIDTPLASNLKSNADENNSSFYSQNMRFFNKADISLCLILYVSSAVLLLLVYFVIIIRRRKRKKIKIPGSV